MHPWICFLLVLLFRSMSCQYSWISFWRLSNHAYATDRYGRPGDDSTFFKASIFGRDGLDECHYRIPRGSDVPWDGDCSAQHRIFKWSARPIFSTASSEDAFLSRLSTMEDNVLERRIELEGLRPVLNGGMRTSRVKLHRVSSSSTSTGRTTQSLKTAAMQNEDREYFAIHSPSPRLVSITTYLCWASYQNVQTEIIDYLYRSKNVKVILAARRTGSSTISARTHIGHRRPETVTVVCTHLADKDINVFG